MFCTYSRAFSLIELLTTLTLITLLASIALPSLAGLIERNRITSLRDQLQAQLQHARASSVLHNQDAEVCGSSDGQHCDDQWRLGWLLYFVDSAQIISQQRLTARDRIMWVGATNRIRFHNNGTSPLGNGRLYICDQHQAAALQIVINRQGRLRQAAGLEAGQNQAIRCR
jgi:type IV fimbrial biogenesis protein FimT